MTVLGDFQTLTTDLLRDDAERVDAGQIARAIALAVAQYGKDRDRRVVEDVIAPGGHTIDHPANAKVLAIEYPIGNVPPTYVGRMEWSLYQEPDALKISFLRPFNDGETLRLTLARAHVLNDEIDTIPVSDREAVVSYTAAVLFDQIAAETSGDGNPTIAADTVNHQSKPENFAKRAERLRQRYYDLLGIDPKRVQAASVTVTQPLASTTGGPRLTHYRGRRRRGF